MNPDLRVVTRYVRVAANGRPAIVLAFFLGAALFVIPLAAAPYVFKAGISALLSAAKQK